MGVMWIHFVHYSIKMNQTFPICKFIILLNCEVNVISLFFSSLETDAFSQLGNSIHFEEGKDATLLNCKYGIIILNQTIYLTMASNCSGQKYSSFLSLSVSVVKNKFKYKDNAFLHTIESGLTRHVI